MKGKIMGKREEKRARQHQKALKLTNEILHFYDIRTEEYPEDKREHFKLRLVHDLVYICECVRLGNQLPRARGFVEGEYEREGPGADPYTDMSMIMWLNTFYDLSSRKPFDVLVALREIFDPDTEPDIGKDMFTVFWEKDKDRPANMMKFKVIRRKK